MLHWNSIVLQRIRQEAGLIIYVVWPDMALSARLTNTVSNEHILVRHVAKVSEPLPVNHPFAPTPIGNYRDRILVGDQTFSDEPDQ